MAHGLVFGGIGLDLGFNRFAEACGYKRHRPQAHQTGLLTQPQHLHKQARQCIEVNEAEIYAYNSGSTIIRGS